MALLATPEIPNIAAIPAIFHPQSGHDGLMFPSSFQQIFSISEGVTAAAAGGGGGRWGWG